MNSKQEERLLEREPGGSPLPRCTHDGKTGLSYKLVDGTYYLLDEELSETEDNQLGLWGRRRLRYLQECRRSTFIELKLAGELFEHLLETEQSAVALFDQLTSLMASCEGLDEQLKHEDQMAWVKATNSIHQKAAEIVMAELIHI